jgi:hypothetical protein
MPPLAALRHTVCLVTQPLVRIEGRTPRCWCTGQVARQLALCLQPVMWPGIIGALDTLAARHRVLMRGCDPAEMVAKLLRISRAEINAAVSRVGHNSGADNAAHS